MFKAQNWDLKKQTAECYCKKHMTQRTLLLPIFIVDSLSDTQPHDDLHATTKCSATTGLIPPNHYGCGHYLPQLCLNYIKPCSAASCSI